MKIWMNLSIKSCWLFLTTEIVVFHCYWQKIHNFMVPHIKQLESVHLVQNNCVVGLLHNHYKGIDCNILGFYMCKVLNKVKWHDEIYAYRCEQSMLFGVGFDSSTLRCIVSYCHQYNIHCIWIVFLLDDAYCTDIVLWLMYRDTYCIAVLDTCTKL